MIKLENRDTYGWESAIRSMRNPLNSWQKSDSVFDTDTYEYYIGEADLKLAKKLVHAGTDHSKFMRMIGVTVDITAPLYWWKQASTYKVGTVANSCSTMHTIAKNEFTVDNFSHEHLIGDFGTNDSDKNKFDVDNFSDSSLEAVLVSLLSESGKVADLHLTSTELLQLIIKCLNAYREKFLKTGDKKYWWQMIQLLPTSYNQKRTWSANYAVLRNIYHSRKNHKLDEWHTFCEWIEGLPYSELITME
jgi:hypothetical protein